MEHLEERINELSTDLKAHRTESSETLRKIREDIAELVELKHRGQGAFWLMTAFASSGIVGVIFGLWELFTNGRGNHG